MHSLNSGLLFTRRGCPCHAVHGMMRTASDSGKLCGQMGWVLLLLIVALN
jgi:hypothetical protein